MNRQLTVIQLLPALDAGGVERSTVEIAEALCRAGHRAIVVSGGGRMLTQLIEAGAEHVQLDIGRKTFLSFRHVLTLRRLFRDADIVHARSRLPAWLAYLACRSLGRQTPRWVTTVHGLNSVSYYSSIMTRGERVIAVSNTVRDYIVRNYPKLDAGRVRVIPRGIDADVFPSGYRAGTEWRARFEAEYPALVGAPWICLPGRGTRLKGHADALVLLAALRDSGIDARLIFLGAKQSGRDRYLDELLTESKRLNLTDKIVLTPPRSDVREVMAESAFVLQLSRKPEAFGRTVIEALHLGVPVLGWAHGGVGELLAELFPEGAVALGNSPELFARARNFLLQRPIPKPFAGYRLSAMQSTTLELYAELAAETQV